MTVQLDNVISIGNVVVAALARRVTHCSEQFGIISVYGTKRPLAVLVFRDGVTTAYELDGAVIAADEFESRHPGHRATFERLTNGNRDIEMR